MWWVHQVNKKRNKVRIIGGQFGSRTLAFTEVDGLRPTLDRVRETLFNWLQADVINATCLDLFTGSGALGFEAASRGAKHVTMVEKHKQVAAQLKNNAQLLKIANIDIKNQSAQTMIEQSTQTFDIIFIDPPFAMDAIEALPKLIESSELMGDKTRVYLECSAKQSYDIPKNWNVLKNKKVGDVRFQLAQRLTN